MTTLVIDRQILPEPLLSFIGAPRIRVEGEADRVVLTPEANASASSRRPTIDEIFDGYLFPMKDFKFDRSEANNYD